MKPPMDKPGDLSAITVLVINYRTLDLTERCISSLLTHYPRIPLLVVDNGSADASTEYLHSLEAAHPNIQAVFHPKNIYHGPALHQAIQAAATPYVFSLDSDCHVLKPGFLEAMSACFSDPLLYAVGRMAWINRYGYEQKQPGKGSLATVHPAAMLLDRLKYLNLKPIIHHGSPCLNNMRSAVQAGFHLAHFPVEDYIYHQGRGTCARFGYGLGWRHVIEYFLNQIPPLTK